MNFDAFISYASKDKPTADAVCAALEDAHIRCWIAPRDILPGSDWSASIIDALDQCRVMILIFSGNANDSPQIRNEVVHAVHRGVPVIPVRIEDIPPGKSLAYFMSGVHWLDALSPPLEAHLKRLAETVRTMLQLVPGAEPSAGTAAAAARTTGSEQEVMALASAGPQPGTASLGPPPVSTRQGKNGAPRAAALSERVGAALVGAVSAGFLAAGAATYFSPAWDRWFQSAPSAVATKTAPAAPQPLAGSTLLTEQLLARYAAALPSLSTQAREQRVRDYVPPAGQMRKAPKMQRSKTARLFTVNRACWLQSMRPSCRLRAEGSGRAAICRVFVMPEILIRTRSRGQHICVSARILPGTPQRQARRRSRITRRAGSSW